MARDPNRWSDALGALADGGSKMVAQSMRSDESERDRQWRERQADLENTRAENRMRLKATLDADALLAAEDRKNAEWERRFAKEQAEADRRLDKQLAIEDKRLARSDSKEDNDIMFRAEQATNKMLADVRSKYDELLEPTPQQTASFKSDYSRIALALYRRGVREGWSGYDNTAEGAATILQPYSFGEPKFLNAMVAEAGILTGLTPPPQMGGKKGGGKKGGGQETKEEHLASGKEWKTILDQEQETGKPYMTDAGEEPAPVLSTTKQPNVSEPGIDPSQSAAQEVMPAEEGRTIGNSPIGMIGGALMDNVLQPMRDYRQKNLDAGRQRLADKEKNALGARLSKAADSLFGLEDTPEKQRWIQEQSQIGVAKPSASGVAQPAIP